MRIGILGGGAAGFFAAVNLIEQFPDIQIEILEKTERVLQKVFISGGGRCNLTHAIFEPRQLINFYPRGGKALLGPFSRFGPEETIRWFEERGVHLKTYPDGNIFPETNSSQTVIDCLLKGANSPKCSIRTGIDIQSIQANPDGENRFIIADIEGISRVYDRILFATGSSRKPLRWAAALGHEIVPPVASLFSFVIDDPGLFELAGIVVESVSLHIKGRKQKSTGELLITHTGLSGPATLRLSSLEARHLAECSYRSTVEINWCGGLSIEKITANLESYKKESPAKRASTVPPFSLPARLWKFLLLRADIQEDTLRGDLSRRNLLNISENLYRFPCAISGKNTHKQEFVTAGGVSLKEVDFRTMESKIVPGIYFAGEILDVDGFTGGFNFQNAWTTAFIAAMSMGESSR